MTVLSTKSLGIGIDVTSVILCSSLKVRWLSCLGSFNLIVRNCSKMIAWLILL